MNQEPTPAKVRLTDGLGPLPPSMGDYPEPQEDVWREEDMRAERQRCYALGVAAERERWVKLVPTQHVQEKWHESEAHRQADMSFCAGWNAARKAMLSALNEGPNVADKRHGTVLRDGSA